MSGFFNGKFIAKFVAALAGLGIVAGLVGFVLVFFGAIPLAADKNDPRLLYHVVHSTFKRWVASNAGSVEAPDDLDDEGRIALGAQHFAQNCVRCHGAPGIGQNPMVLAMKPTPQHLPAVINQFTDEELFVILDNGVMMSAMPAWPTVGREDEIWSMVAFIRQIDEMDAASYLDLVTPDVADAPVMAFGDDARGEPMDYHTKRYPMEEHLYSAPTGGFADYALAGVPVAQCATCHGADGGGAPTYGEAPNLTLQSPEYIAAALRSFAKADRHSAYMQVVAAQLSDPQIDALAEYYGTTLPDVGPVVATAPSQEEIDRGEQLAVAGRPSDGISACYDCHGREGTEDASGLLVPHLSGQTQAYMTRQLEQFRRGGRGQTAVWSPMVGVANGMTDEDISAVAAYFATRDAGETPPRQDEAAPASMAQIARAEDLVEEVCSECHESNLLGAPSGETPNLSLQGADYVERQLYDFRALRRDNSRMHQAALRLEEDDITSLAAYLGGLEPQPRSAAEPVSEDVALGEDIARNGLPDAGVPSCLTCHGAAATGTLSQIPRLHAQNGEYLATRLDYFKDADPEDITDYSPMPQIASQMSDEQIRAAAAWFAAQEPLAKN